MWIFCDLEEGLEQVADDLFKVLDQVVALVDVKKPRHLDDPPHVVRVNLKGTKVMDHFKRHSQHPQILFSAVYLRCSIIFIPGGLLPTRQVCPTPQETVRKLTVGARGSDTWTPPHHASLR